MPEDKPKLRLVREPSAEPSVHARKARAEEVNVAVQVLNDHVLRDMDKVGMPLVHRWRAFRAKWTAWYNRTTATTWWWDATAQLVDSYAAELEALRADYARALSRPPLPAPAPRPLASLDLVQAAPPKADYTPLLLLGAVGVGLWYYAQKTPPRPPPDNDFGVKKILERGGRWPGGGDIGNIDSAQVPELELEELDIGEGDPEDEDEWLEDDEIEDERGNILVPGPVPGFYVPKPWKLNPTWLRPDELGGDVNEDEDDEDDEDDEEDAPPAPPARRGRGRRA